MVLSAIGVPRVIGTTHGHPCAELLADIRSGHDGHLVANKYFPEKFQL